MLFIISLQLRDDQNRVWLLLFDLHMRHFQKRDPKERAKEKELYHKSDLKGSTIYRDTDYSNNYCSRFYLQSFTKIFGIIEFNWLRQFHDCELKIVH